VAGTRLCQHISTARSLRASEQTGATMKLKRSWVAGLISLVVVLIFSLTFLGSDEQHRSQLNPAPMVAPDRRIEVGIHIKTIYNLSLKDKTFNADGWFWLKWPESIQQQIEADRIPINQLVELVNQVETYDSNLEMDNNEPQRLKDGRYLQLFRFSSKFYDEQQNLRNFPFERIELPISIEIRPSQFSMGNQGVVLVPKLNARELQGDSIHLNGYMPEGSNNTSAIHVYQTTFGDKSSTRAGEFSQATFEVTYHTNGWASFYSFVLPWMAVMVILMLAPNLEGNLNDLRLAIPSTALLTLVFLQEGAHSDLPPLGYLTYLDKLYLFGYLAATAEFCLFVWSTNLFSRASSEEHSAVMARINRVDLTYQLCSIAGMVCLLLLGRTAN